MTASLVVAVDPEAGGLTYSIVGGADASLLTINSSSGLLAFTSIPRHASPADADGNNVYEVIVAATDGTWSPQQNVFVIVDDYNQVAIALPDTYQTFASQALIVAGAGVLSNGQ